MKDDKEFVLITGASFGIGKELTQIFASHGYPLILAARSGEVLRETARSLGEHFGVETAVFTADLARPGAPRRLYEDIRQTGKPVGILVNNAGSGMHGLFAEMNEKQLSDMVELNVKALTELTRLFLPEMIRRGKGRILNVASTAAFQPGPLMAAYYATKAYVLSFSQALSEELKGTGVTVTTLCPGPTHTEFQQRAGIGKVAVFTYGVMAARLVAEAGFRGLMRGKRVVIPGLLNRILALGAKFAPVWLSLKAAKWLQKEKIRSKD